MQRSSGAPSRPSNYGGMNLPALSPQSSEACPQVVVGGQPQTGAVVTTQVPMKRALAGFQSLTILFRVSASGVSTSNPETSAPKKIPNWFQIAGGVPSHVIPEWVANTTEPPAPVRYE